MDGLKQLFRGVPHHSAVRCSGCGEGTMAEFYSVEDVPVHSVLLMPTREKAINYRRGDISLGYCGSCGHISNTAYISESQEYSPLCEESQGYSPTHNAFSLELANDLIERYGLRGKKILEIGCGKGEFLTLICELGGNSGLGYDPAYVKGRSEASDRVRFVNEFFTANHSSAKFDFFICQMTMEHIYDVEGFLHSLRRSMGAREDAVLFLQVPDAERILKELAFWDVYYEHCSYFSEPSLMALLSKAGFTAVRSRKAYGGQYILVEAKPGRRVEEAADAQASLGRLEKTVAAFSESCRQKIALWKSRISEMDETGYRTVLWGSGSKAVAFLTTLGINSEIKYVVDINPNRHNTYMAGTGQEIVPPSFLKIYRPDAVILMNPVYRKEVSRELGRLNCATRLFTL